MMVFVVDHSRRSTNVLSFSTNLPPWVLKRSPSSSPSPSLLRTALIKLEDGFVQAFGTSLIEFEPELTTVSMPGARGELQGPHKPYIEALQTITSACCCVPFSFDLSPASLQLYLVLQSTPCNINWPRKRTRALPNEPLEFPPLDFCTSSSLGFLLALRLAQ